MAGAYDESGVGFYCMRCGICDINWPYHADFSTCRKCGEPIQAMHIKAPSDGEKPMTVAEARALIAQLEEDDRLEREAEANVQRARDQAATAAAACLRYDVDTEWLEAENLEAWVREAST